MDTNTPKDTMAKDHGEPTTSEVTDKRLVGIYPQQKNLQRYVILDASTGALASDAQGHGYRTFENAVAYAENQGWVVTNMPAIESTPLF